MKTRLMSTRYVGTMPGQHDQAQPAAPTYQLRWTASRNSPRSCPYAVLKTKRTRASDLLPADGAEHALRPDREHQQQHDVGGDVLEAVRQVGAGEQLDEADGDAADQRARDRAEAAEHGGREGLEPDEAEVDVDQRHRRQQHAGDGGHAGRDRPDQREHPLHRDPHVVGGELVLRGGLHGHADPRCT